MLENQTVILILCRKESSSNGGFPLQFWLFVKVPGECITSFTVSSHVPDGSFPLFSDFRLGRLIGGGIRRAAVATFPKLCNPWPRETTNNIIQ